MEVIANLCDRLLLGTDGRSSAEGTESVRLILRNFQGKYGVFFDFEKKLYHFPIVQVAAGQAPMEEILHYVPLITGISARTAKELCAISEDSMALNRRELTRYFLVEMDKEEEALGRITAQIPCHLVLQWMEFYEAKSKIKEPLQRTAEGIYSQFKDGIAFGYYSQICPEEASFHGEMLAPGLVNSSDQDIDFRIGRSAVPGRWVPKKSEYTLYYKGNMEIIGPSDEDNAIG